MSLRLIEQMEKSEDIDQFARLDKIAGRSLQLLNSCSRMVLPGTGSQQEQEEATSPG
ncbi:MAG: hypothetical protein AAGB26_13470 [Planctomycetota bacterium]